MTTGRAHAKSNQWPCQFGPNGTVATPDLQRPLFLKMQSRFLEKSEVYRLNCWRKRSCAVFCPVFVTSSFTTCKFSPPGKFFRLRHHIQPEISSTEKLIGRHCEYVFYYPGTIVLASGEDDWTVAFSLKIHYGCRKNGANRGRGYRITAKI